MNKSTGRLFGSLSIGNISRLAGFACGVLLLSPLAFGVSSPSSDLELPEVVVKSIDSTMLEAKRNAVLPLEPPKIAQPDVRVDLPGDSLPEIGKRASPKVQSPGCAYRNPVTGAIARAAKGPEALYKTGQERLSRNLLEDAKYYFAQLRETAPDNPRSDDAAFWLAEIYNRQGKQEDAISFLRLVKGAYASEARYRLARLLEDNNRPEEAATLWEKVASDSGSAHRPEAIYRVGVRRLASGKSAEAAKAFEKVAIVGSSELSVPEDVRSAALLGLGMARRDLKEFEKAENHLMRFLIDYPDHPSAPSARVILGWTLLDQGKADEAILRFDRIIDKGSKSRDILIRALFGKVRALIEKSDIDAADEALQVLVDERPKGPWEGWAKADIAWLAFKKGQRNDALVWYRSALDAWNGPGADVPKFMMAECLYLLQRYEEAARAFQNIEVGSSLYPTALHRAGLCFLLAGDFFEAERAFMKNLTLYPENPESGRVWAWLGETRLRMGRRGEAVQAFSKVPVESPAHAQALYGMAWAAFENESWEEAVSRFTEFLKAYPADPNREEAMLTLARAEFNSRDADSALAALKKLETEAVNKEYAAAAAYYRGWMLARSGKIEEGKQLLKGVLEKDATGPYAAKAMLSLGQVDYGLGAYSSAVESFKKAAELGEGSEIEKEARQKIADSLYNLGQHQQALEAYQALNSSPDARYGEALCLYRLGRVKELSKAAYAFAADFQNDPRAADLLFTLGQALAEVGNPSESANVYKKAAEIALESDKKKEAQLEAAKSLIVAGETSQAVEMLETLASRSGPLRLPALRELAKIFEEKGMIAKALDAWDRIVKFSEEEERCRAYRSSAKLTLMALNFEDARRRLSAALEVCPQEAEIMRQALLTDMGEVWLLEGVLSKAMESLSKASEMGKSSEGLRALLTMARAQEAHELQQEALETYLRIGYLYSVNDAGVADALLRAGTMFEENGKVDNARSLYKKIVAGGGEQGVEEAKRRLTLLTPP